MVSILRNGLTTKDTNYGNEYHTDIPHNHLRISTKLIVCKSEKNIIMNTFANVNQIQQKIVNNIFLPTNLIGVCRIEMKRLLIPELVYIINITEYMWYKFRNWVPGWHGDKSMCNQIYLISCILITTLQPCLPYIGLCP